MARRPDETELELPIEKRACDWAESYGWWQTKFQIPGTRGGPDRMFVKRVGLQQRVVLIEFKRPGKEPSRQQEKRHVELRRAGFDVFWADNLERVVEILS